MKPGLLIASPQMQDPNFSGALVLLCHHDPEGALGIIINRATTLSIGELLRQLEVGPDEENPEQVLWGGPVEQGAGFVVFSGQVQNDTGWNLPDQLAVSPSRQLLEDVVENETPFFLCLGYAGWGPGQLEAEIATGSWLYTEVSDHLVFGVPIADRYRHALGTLGLTPEQIWMQPVNE